MLLADDPSRVVVSLLSSHDGHRHLVRLAVDSDAVTLVPADARRVAAALIHAAHDADERRARRGAGPR
jgi:hypothetical protein